MSTSPIPRHRLLVLDGRGQRDDAGTLGLWPYTQQRWRWWRSGRHELVDPINALAVDVPPAELHRALEAQGWARPSDGAVHRTWVDGRFVRMSDHIALGDRQERVHVRLFAYGPHTLAAAHHEVADARGHHVVTSWDRARAVLMDALTAAGWGADGSVDGATVANVRGVPGDGRIWRARRGGG